MNRYPTTQNNQAVQKSEGDEVKVLEPSDDGNPFFFFRYSYKSMTSVGGKTYVASEEKRYENGKLESESFEGVMEGDYLARAVQDMQNLFFKQISYFFKPFSFFLPFSDDDPKRR